MVSLQILDKTEDLELFSFWFTDDPCLLRDFLIPKLQT